MAKSWKLISIVGLFLLAIAACLFFRPSSLFGPYALFGPSIKSLPIKLQPKGLQPEVGQGLNIDLVSQTGGLPDSDFLASPVSQDDIMFIGLGLRLVSFDLSNLPEIKQIGETAALNGEIRGMTLRNDRLYALASGLLYIYDISEPSNLALLGTHRLGNSDDLLFSDLLFYEEQLIVDIDDTINIFDVSSPANVKVLGQYTPGCCLSGMVLKGSHLFLESKEPAVLILDIADPNNIKKSNSLFPQGVSHGVAIKDDLLFLEGLSIYTQYDQTSGLYVFDISNPENPVEVVFYKDDTFSWITTIHNDTLYRQGHDKLQLIDISNPAKPMLMGTLCYGGASRFLGMYENFMLIVYDDAFQLIDHFPLPEPKSGNTCIVQEQGKVMGSFTPLGGWSVQAKDDLVFISGYDSGEIQIVDVSDPETPFPVYYEGRARTDEVLLHNDYLFLNWYDFEVFDFSVPSIPSLVHEQELENQIDQIVLEGNRAFVNDWNDNFYIFDISDPSAPVMLAKHSSFPDIARIYDFDVVENYVYIADYKEDDLHILDLSNPTMPQELGRLETRYPIAPSLKVIKAYDGFVFLEERRQRGMEISKYLSVIDITDPTNPRYLTTYSWCQGCTFGGNSQEMVHVVNYWGTLFLFDFTDPLNPISLGHYRLPMPYAYSPSIDIGENGEIYVVDEKYGLIILQLTDSEN